MHVCLVGTNVGAIDGDSDDIRNASRWGSMASQSFSMMMEFDVEKSSDSSPERAFSPAVTTGDPVPSL